MRRCLLGLLLVLSACAGAEPGSTTTSPAVATTSTTIEPATSTTAPATTTTAPATTTTTLAPLQSLAYEEVGALPFPVQMVPWEAFDLIATKDGRVWLYERTSGQVSEEPVLDIRDQVRNSGEQGLLSIAVDPDDPEGRLFAHYSDLSGDTVVSWFGWGGGRWEGEHVVLRVDQPARNHNGGMIQFGADGFLYLGLGDGGGANDRYGNGQNRDTLLGGLVRIDADDPGAEPILYQYGLRNPWRFWIEDDLIYIADVGQNTYEEIDVAPLLPDVNYGWPVYEGLHCFSAGCEGDGWTFPLVEVTHGDAGTCSITGGVVYRGAAIPEIDGHYFYSDYCGGYLRSFRYLFSGEVADQTDWTDQVGVPGSVVGFGVDGFGEMYVMTTDRMLKLAPVRG